MPIREELVTAAGGNGTAIRVVSTSLSRTEYERIGKELTDKYEALGAEQAGFLVLEDSHFEMAGGEFCGNATRSAAVLLHEATGADALDFTVSGFDGVVHADVTSTDTSQYHVEVVFPGMRADYEEVTLADGTPASIVDLGGIVHVVINGVFPAEPDEYSAQHRKIVEQFNLMDRDAVGVVWYQEVGDSIVMHPVVWVRAVDTFYYETSCGSGTIAVASVTSVSSIIQPSGMSISADVTEGKVVLKSAMEVVR